jgi:urease accessory protein
MERPGTPTTVLAVLIAAAAGPLLAATPVLAHTGHPGNGLTDGLLHPLTGPDHLLAMVAVGIVAAVAVPRPRRWATPVAFLVGMALGGLAGLAGVPLPGAEHLIVASVVVLGLVVAGAVRIDHDLLLGALVLAGVAHGHAHGAEAPFSAHPAVYVAGFLAVTALLHTGGVVLGSMLRDRRPLRLGVGLATVSTGALLVL